MKNLLFLAFVFPLFLSAQTSYDKTQDTKITVSTNKNVLQDTVDARMQRNITLLFQQTAEFYLRTDSANARIARLTKLLSDLQIQLNAVQTVANNAATEAGKKPLLNFDTTALVVTTNKDGSYGITVRNYTALISGIAAAAKSTSDVSAINQTIQTLNTALDALKLKLASLKATTTIQ